MKELIASKLFIPLFISILSIIVSNFITNRINKSNIRREITIKYIDEITIMNNKIDELKKFILNNDPTEENAKIMSKQFDDTISGFIRIINSIELNNSLLRVDHQILENFLNLVNLAVSKNLNDTIKFLVNAKDNLIEINNEIYSSIGFKKIHLMIKKNKL